MSLDFLPTDIENMIVNYRNQIEISEKYDKVVAEFKKKYTKKYSWLGQNLLGQNTSVWRRDKCTIYELINGALIVAKEGFYDYEEDLYEYEETCVIFKDKCYYKRSEIDNILNLI